MMNDLAICSESAAKYHPQVEVLVLGPVSKLDRPELFHENRAIL
jgi:hypothetical protein